jgi:hypothetical protein
MFVGLDILLSQSRQMQNQPLSQAREKLLRGLFRAFLAVQAPASAVERM